MLKTAVIATILLFSVTARAALPICHAEDNECLIRLSLQQTLELEAEQQRLAHCQRSNDLLKSALDEEEKRSDHGGRVFVFGMLTGVVFTGLLATIAMKAIGMGKNK